MLRVAFVDIELDPMVVRGFEPGRSTYRADMGALTLVVERLATFSRAGPTRCSKRRTSVKSVARRTGTP